MREVDELENTEHEGIAEGDQRVDGAKTQAIDGVLDKLVQGKTSRVFKATKNSAPSNCT